MTSNNNIQKIRSTKKRDNFTAIYASDQPIQRRQSKQARQKNRDRMCFETTV